MKLEAIFVYPVKRSQALAVEQVEAVLHKGLTGDHKRSPRRQVTVLSYEAWREACAELGCELPPQARRANLVVSGGDLRALLAQGATLALGEVRLKLCEETTPCKRMDKAHPGLMQALGVDSRCGAIATVEQGGQLEVGMKIEVEDLQPVQVVPDLSMQ